MSELELVGLHEDGEHVVLQGQDGQRFRLPIDDALRAAVRRDRPQLEQLRTERAGVLAPREIQARIRAGSTAEEVAEASGTPIEHVRRYEGPVLAEREFVAGQARATRIGHDPSAPVLGDLVTDRLATRGVPADGIEWDAYRSGTGPWTVEVEFSVGDSPRSARWTYDAGARTVRAVDDEARWLSETEIADGPIPRRHLAAVPVDEVDDALRPLLASVDVTRPAPEPEPEPEPDVHAATEALLDDLADRRGVRQPLEVDEDDDDLEEFEGFGPQHTFDFEGSGLPPVPAAHPPHSRPEEATDARVLEMPTGRPRRAPDDEDDATDADAPAGHDQPALLDDAGTEPARPAEPTTPATPATPTTPPEPSTPAAGPAPDAPAASTGTDQPASARQRARRGRASVPSWDEIVFGAKQD